MEQENLTGAKLKALAEALDVSSIELEDNKKHFNVIKCLFPHKSYRLNHQHIIDAVSRQTDEVQRTYFDNLTSESTQDELENPKELLLRVAREIHNADIPTRLKALAAALTGGE